MGNGMAPREEAGGGGCGGSTVEGGGCVGLKTEWRRRPNAYASAAATSWLGECQLQCPAKDRATYDFRTDQPAFFTSGGANASDPGKEPPIALGGRRQRW